MSTARRFLTVKDILDDLGESPNKPLPRSTWDEWIAKGKTPPYRKLPNGQIRVRVVDYERWLDNLEGEAA